MKKIILIFSILTLLIVGAGFKGCKKKTNSSSGVTVYATTTEVTPKGAKVYSKNGVLNKSMLTAVDEELTALSNDVDARNYTRYRLPSDYAVYVKSDCVLSPNTRTRSFLVNDPSNSYDGTIYDRDPRPGHTSVLAAEMVITAKNVPTNGYIVCDNSVVDAEMRDAVRFGPEHIILYYNDRTEFDRTAVHLTGGHPLIPRLNNSLTEKAKDRPDDVTDFGGEVTIIN